MSMAGQLIQRGDRTWLVRVFRGREPQTGKRCYHNHTVNGNKRDAQRYLNGVLRELDLGTFVEPSRTTLDEYLDRWLKAAARPRLSERTYLDYQDLLRRYVRPTLGSKRLSDLRPLDIQSLYSFLQEEGGGWRAKVVLADGPFKKSQQRRANTENEAQCLLEEMRQEVMNAGRRILEADTHKVPLSPRTVRYVHAVLSSALKQAVKWRLAASNPASFAELPKRRRE